VVSSKDFGQRQAGIVDHNVDAAEREQRGINGCLYGSFIGDVGGDADRDVLVAYLLGSGLSVALV
jgi:hypothetical protein